LTPYRHRPPKVLDQNLAHFPVEYNTMALWEETTDALRWAAYDSSSHAALQMLESIDISNSGEYLFDVHFYTSGWEGTGIWVAALTSSGDNEVDCYDTDISRCTGYTGSHLSLMPDYTCPTYSTRTNVSFDWDYTEQGDVGEEISDFELVSLHCDSGGSSRADRSNLARLGFWVR
jgi:hypothetical protein